MKYFILPIVLIFCAELNAQGSIRGKINNFNNLRDSSFKIVFMQNNKRTDSTLTGTAGFYNKNIKSGIYDIELSKTGHIPVLLKGIFLNNGNTSINFSVRFIPAPTYAAVDPVSKSTTVIVSDSSAKFAGFVRPRGDSSTPSYTFGTAASESVSSSSLERKMAYSPATTTTTVSGTSFKKSSASGKGSGTGTGSGSAKKAEAFKGVDFDGDMDAAAPPVVEESMSKEVEDAKMPAPASEQPAIKAGQVTAGHWRDLDNWKDWESTNNTEAISKFQGIWGFYPKTLMRIKFKGNDKRPLAFTNVSLLDNSNKLLWQTKTDQEGNAYFWPSIFSAGENNSYKVKVTKNGQEKTLNNINSFINSENSLQVELSGNNEHLLEVAFVVDATGSMGDEIRYLQVELMDVINRVQKKNRCLNMKTASIFYKDMGDDYVTSVLPMSDNPANTINFIGNHSANGGGDFPEAVDMAMHDAVTKLNWSNTDNPKVMFLLLDAPPHQDTASKRRMRTYTAMAAAKGIRIVPIAASGIDKTTEFLLKYMAITTNGEYIYITDDSKIGNTHLKPTGGESKVTYLNDLMVDIINTYSEGKWCREIVTIDSSKISPNTKDSLQAEDSSQYRQQDNAEIIAGNNWYMKFYPNPAVNVLQLDFSEVAQHIKITDISGKVMFQTENKGSTTLSIDISSWNTGVYLVYAVKASETISGKLLVMH